MDSHQSALQCYGLSLWRTVAYRELNGEAEHLRAGIADVDGQRVVLIGIGCGYVVACT